MQFRQLRYFVKIVEAGSISRAATTIHVAQPALSQQIADLEAQLGVTLLQRSARGVRPTSAGEILYREASTILRLLERLPTVIRSSEGAIEGVVSLGMSSTLAGTLAGSFIEACREALPKVVLKFIAADSQTVKARIEAQTLDLAIVFEDELSSVFFRKPLLRQRLYLVCRDRPRGLNATSIPLERVADMPLILPGAANVLRGVVDRAFASACVIPRIVVEADVLSSILSAIRTGIGNAILPKGDFSDIAGYEETEALLIEPALFLTASIISSADFPLTQAGESVRNLLEDFVKSRLDAAIAPGAEWIDREP